MSTEGRNWSTGRRWQDDVCANNHGGNPESIEAFCSTNLAKNERLVIELLGYAGQIVGATCDELEVATGLSHQTISSRCSELLRRGLIKRKPIFGQPGKYARRRTRTNRWAAVLVLVKR